MGKNNFLKNLRQLRTFYFPDNINGTIRIAVLILAGALLAEILLAHWTVSSYEKACTLMEEGQKVEAIKIFAKLDGYADSDQKMYEDMDAYIKYLDQKAKPGNLIRIDTSNTPWLVVNREEGRLFCVRTEPLYFAEVFDEQGNVCYGESSIREYLNKEYYADMFTDVVKSHIMPREIELQTDSIYPLPDSCQKEVTNNVFLLSKEEAAAFLKRYKRWSKKYNYYPATWLRSRTQSSENLIDIIDENGKITGSDSPEDKWPVIPGVYLLVSSAVPDDVKTQADQYPPSEQEQIQNEMKAYLFNQKQVEKRKEQKEKEEKLKEKYTSGYSNSHSSSIYEDSAAESYAEDHVEDYLDSGDYDDYDEAYEAAMDDYEYDH